MIYILVLPIAGGLVARLAYDRWQAYAAAGVATLIAFFCLWGFSLRAQDAIGATVIAVGFGTVLPDLAVAFTTWLRQPRTIALILAILVGLFLLANPVLLNQVIVLAILGGLIYWLISSMLPTRRRGGDHGRHH